MFRMQLFRKFPDCSSIWEVDLPVIGEGAAVDDDGHWGGARRRDGTGFFTLHKRRGID